MSLHFKCPHNHTVRCNQSYELNEFYRQVKLFSITGGKYVTVQNKENRKCQVKDATLCPMYQNALLHALQSQKVNTGK